MVIPSKLIAIKTARLPTLNKLPERIPAAISFLMNLLERSNNGIPIAKIDRLEEKNPDWSECVACMGITYEPPIRPDAAAKRYPFFCIDGLFAAFETNGKPASNSPIAAIASTM